MKKIHLENSLTTQVSSYNERTQKRTHDESNSATKFPWVSPRQYYLERVTREMDVKNQKLQKELAIAKSNAVPTPALPSKPTRVSLWPNTDHVPPMPDSL